MLAFTTADSVQFVESSGAEFSVGGESIPRGLRVGCWHPGGDLFAVGTSYFGVAIFNVKKPSEQERSHLGGAGSITCLAFSADGSYLAAGTSAGEVGVWLTTGLRFVRRFQRGKAITGLVWIDNESAVVSALGADLAVMGLSEGTIVRSFPCRNVSLLGRMDVDGLLPTSNGRGVSFIDTRAKRTVKNAIAEASIAGLDSCRSRLLALRLEGGEVEIRKGNRLFLGLSATRDRRDNWMGGIAISPDGRRVAFLEEREVVAIVDLPPVWLGVIKAKTANAFLAIRALAARSAQKVWWAASKLAPNEIPEAELESALREKYAGLMGKRRIVLAVLTFIPVVVAHYWPNVRVSLSFGAAICLCYHLLGFGVWFGIAHISSVRFRPHSRVDELRRLYRLHLGVWCLQYPVLVIVCSIWVSQIDLVFYGHYTIWFPEPVRQFLGIE